MLAALSIPAAVVGIGCALLLRAVDQMAALLEQGLWSALPDALGVDPTSGWWIFATLTGIGIAVGLVLWLAPGHGGEDSATVSLMAPPSPLRVLPSLAVVTVLGLAGGVSLGPESPIIAINTALFVAAIKKLQPSIPTGLVVIVVAAGTIGALFGTPVAAALVFTGVVGSLKIEGELWDRLFLPLVAAATGSVTMSLLAHPSFTLPLPTYTTVAAWDLLSASIIACVAATIGILAAAALPRLHRAFRLLRNPLIYAGIGGALLGVLGAIGGPVTLFKGLQQMDELLDERNSLTVGTLILIVAVKVVALVISAAAGFRGGRVFPAVFIGMAIGVVANAIVPSVPLAVAIAGGVLGMVLAVSRDGWISLFVAVAVTGSVSALPLLCIAVLPTWLLVSRAPVMVVHAHQQEKL
ncbi:H+/Cl- antiporter ClcA [Glaciihabitans tibetensis]|uniref:H+/Cl-antiporter ClcA n=2 Tax=Glaciihabitans tibetensis TaxID=1266600 RepID=A0A2T0VIW0_9MICO|nr:H+/Cl- antiporter ClcA [Glaciihabitans tibetensis]